MIKICSFTIDVRPPGQKKAIKTMYFEGRYMKHVICPVCSNICIKYGKNKSGSQRWYCRNCSGIHTPKIDNS